MANSFPTTTLQARTIGLDIASDNSLNAICCIDWNSNAAEVVHLDVRRMDNAYIVQQIQSLQLPEHCFIDIDDPFGFPVSFLDATKAMSCPRTPPPPMVDIWRETEHYLKNHLKLQPLSSVSSLITNTVAGRCCPIRYALSGNG